jgi:hypothetical protein
MHHRRENLLARQPTKAHVFGDPRPKSGQRLGEFDQVLVFRLLPRLAVVDVVAILLAPLGVAAGGLNVSIRGGADPDVVPCRRDDERTYALKHDGVRDPPAPRIKIDEAFTRPPAPDRRRIVAHIAQAGRRRHGDFDGNTNLGVEHWRTLAFRWNAGRAPPVPVPVWREA